MLDSTQILRQVNEFMTINQQKYKATFPFSARDFILVIRRKFVRINDNIYNNIYNSY